MAVRIAILNQKGGAGKTTVTNHLGVALALQGHRCLLIDFDPQCNLTMSLGFKKDIYVHEGDNIATALLNLNEDPNALIYRAPHDPVDVLPGNYEMYVAPEELLKRDGSEGRFEDLLDRIEVKYDYILVDCPPALNVLTDNALVACRRILIPTLVHDTERGGIGILLSQKRSLEAEIGDNIEIMGIVPVAFEQVPDQEAYLEDLNSLLPGFITPVLRKRQSVIVDARRQGRSIFSYEPSNAYRKKAQRDSQSDFRALCEYVLRQSERIAQ